MNLTADAPIDTNSNQLVFRKLTARIGAEIRGLDLTSVTEEQIKQIRAALNEHKALVFREANVHSNEEQVAFASNFGPLTQAHPTTYSVDGAPEVLPVDSEISVANTWHTDVTFVVNPPQASTLRSVTLPEYGGETLIASTVGAYDDLPVELRSFAESLWAIHSNDYDYVNPKNLEHKNSEEQRKIFTRIKFETAHPVARVHPLAGKRNLFIGAFAQRLRILGVSNTESRDLLRLLQAYVTRPENIVRVNCEPNQVVLFDNRATQHYAQTITTAKPGHSLASRSRATFRSTSTANQATPSKAIPRPTQWWHRSNLPQALVRRPLAPGQRLR